ncbi:N-acetylmuramoyl-L-alanine amidase [Paenisporosarcina sp. TG20]|uniref:N-acetylmuramoyl-L-alanine amidase n=1 Tax=Paenisporosarcina sp. TG20 TaxID=1211706 RepID=UPI0002D91245|nr:N-acetylmuramoyl-L-alanine amidase [Paenisporosarcina sp. TG20]
MKKVAWSAGHGKNTPGKRTPDGEREWTFNNKVVIAGMAYLENYEGVQQIRVDDPSGNTDVPLVTRTNEANAWNADIYVSSHHNAIGTQWGNHSGVETYVMEPASNNPLSVKLANQIHPKVVNAMGLTDRGVKSANFHELRETNMPAALVEGGFMDSRTDILKMRDDSFLKDQGEAIAKGIAEYFDLVKKSEPIEDVKQETPQNHTDGNYKIQNGDTLYSIAEEFGVPVNELQEANQNVNPRALQIGSFINIPNGKYVAHKIENGDTLYSLAQKYKVSLDAIRDVNKGIEARELSIGDTVKIPVVKVSEATPKPKPNMKTVSIVEYLKSIDVDSSYDHRAELAKKHGIPGYQGSAEQNTELLNIMRGAVKDAFEPKLPSGVLRYGDNGNDVRMLQQALNELFFKVGEVDGSYGAKTKDAVERFQKVHDPYHVDGVYGSRTRERMNRLLK